MTSRTASGATALSAAMDSPGNVGLSSGTACSCSLETRSRDRVVTRTVRQGEPAGTGEVYVRHGAQTLTDGLPGTWNRQPASATLFKRCPIGIPNPDPWLSLAPNRPG